MSGSITTISADRILHVNGKPFFPIGARHMPVGATPALLKKVGFNAMRWPAFGMDADAIPRANLPEDLGGLMFYPYVWNRGDLSEDTETRKQQLMELVLEVREHPSLLCYEQRNEPAYTFRDYARPQSPAEGMIAGSRLIRELDRNHPIRVGHMVCNLVSTLRKYNEAVDIVGCNPYVILAPGMRQFVGCRTDGLLVDSPNQTLSAVGDLTTKMGRVAEGRPVWMQLQASANENWYNETHTPEIRRTGIYEHHRLYPSRWQMRFMAFNSIIRGATALEWMMIRLPVDSGPWQDVCQVIGELRDLHDVLCSPNWPGTIKVEYKELGFSDWTGVEVIVKLCQNRPWILAANTQFDPMEATFSNLPEGLGKEFEVINEGRRVTIAAGTFSDRFQPYEVHVYAPRD
jgi:hypothetical protein